MEEILEPQTKRPYRLTGERLKGKGLLARALLESGESQVTTSKIAGISRASVQALSHRKIVPTSQVDSIVRSLRSRSALLASSALIGITEEKLTEASALECAKVFDLAMKNAGLAPASVTENYSFSVSKYLNSTASTPSDEPVKKL